MKELFKKILTKKSKGFVIEMTGIVYSFGGMTCGLYSAEKLAAEGRIFPSCLAIFIALLALMYPVAKWDAKLTMTPEQKAIDDAEEAAGYEFWED